MAFGDYQLEIYLQGLSGVLPSHPMAFAELEAKAQAAMSPSLWSYVAGGAGDERTQRVNVTAFERWGVMPRMFVGAKERDVSVDLFGMTLPSPVFMAPIGVIGLCAQDGHGDLAAAKAAARTGVPMMTSTLTADPLEEVAAEFGDTPGFFQLYTPTDRDLAASLVSRAEAAGYKGIVVTLDTWVPGWRPRDLSTSNFPQLRGHCLSNYTSDPVFRASLAQTPEENPQAAILKWISVFGNSLSWNDLPWLRSLTTLPLLVKGIQHPDDARSAVDGGVDGIYCSNHGGRQANGGLPAIDCLPGVVEARQGRAGAVRLRHPQRRRHREGIGAGGHRGRGRAAIRLRHGARRRRRRGARASVPARRGGPHHGRRRICLAQGAGAGRAAARRVGGSVPMRAVRCLDGNLDVVDAASRSRRRANSSSR